MSSNSFLFRHVRTLMFALTALPLVSHAAVETIAKGQLTYGTAATFMPFEYVKAGKLTGFDIDLINALSKEIQLTPAPMPMEFKGLIPALQGKRLDIINSAMYVNPTRAEQVDFVPYLKIGSRVVVRKGNPANITGRDLSLCGKNIADARRDRREPGAGRQSALRGGQKTGHQRHDVPRRHRFRRGRRPGTCRCRVPLHAGHRRPVYRKSRHVRSGWRRVRSEYSHRLCRA